MPAAAKKRQQEVVLPLLPFQNWIKQRELHYGSLAQLADACAISVRRLFALKEGYENIAVAKRNGHPARKSIATVTLTTADHCLTHEGSTFLWEIWPELDSDRPIESLL